MPPKIQPGDLVRRKYHITIQNWSYFDLGLVVERDNNGFLNVLWGSKIESLWDEYDLMKVEDAPAG
jgi:hypothetical protein